MTWFSRTSPLDSQPQLLPTSSFNNQATFFLGKAIMAIFIKSNNEGLQS
jgi:hypothetical protein